MTEGEGIVIGGHALPSTELPSQKVLDKGLHERVAENASKAAAKKIVEEPEVAAHLETVASELHEIAQAGEKPLDHISRKDSYIAEAVQSTARLLDDPDANAERPITYGDFQRELKEHDSGYVSEATLSPDDPKMQEKVEMLESVLGAREKHEVPSDDPHQKIEEATTNVGVKLREVTDDEGNLKMSVVKMSRSRMQPPMR